MAHLDTAYKLGALQAQANFEQEINKMAAGALPGQPVTPPPAAAPPRAPGTFQIPPAATPSPINPDARAGMKNRGY